MIKPLSNKDLYKSIHVDMLGGALPKAKSKNNELIDKDKKIIELQQSVRYWKEQYNREKMKNKSR